jgi:murein L,D-transpeptidase YafK
VHAASGALGPKLREGDEQVPEGVYRITGLNPNSQYHLSLRVDYPNAADRERARAEGRDDLGGDIMIHGRAVSVGCLAMGDSAAEELFVLAAETGLPKLRVILSPLDFRRRALPRSLVPARPWVPALYDEIRAELAKLP